MVGRDAAAGGAVAEGMAGGVEYELRLLEEGEPGMGGDGKGDNCSLWVIDLPKEANKIVKGSHSPFS